MQSNNNVKKAVDGYQFGVLWWSSASVGHVWDVLANYSSWPTWWRGIQRVEVLRKGDESGVGTVLHQRWRSRLPYTLRFDLEMMKIEGGKLLEGRASGDLVGTCRWTLNPVDGGTELHFVVDVRTGRWWMNLPVPFLSKIVRSSFNTIMGWGREGLEKILGTPVLQRTSDGQDWLDANEMIGDFEKQSS